MPYIKAASSTNHNNMSSSSDIRAALDDLDRSDIFFFFFSLLHHLLSRMDAIDSSLNATAYFAIKAGRITRKVDKNVQGTDAYCCSCRSNLVPVFTATFLPRTWRPCYVLVVSLPLLQILDKFLQFPSRSRHVLPLPTASTCTDKLLN